MFEILAILPVFGSDTFLGTGLSQQISQKAESGAEKH